MNLSVKYFLIALLPLLIAYAMEIFWQIMPCNLCLWQRVPFFLICALALMNFKMGNRFLFGLMITLFMVNSGLAVYNFAIEQHWLDASCELKVDNELLSEMLPQSMVPCDMPYFQFFGFISIAFANIFYCLLAALLGIFCMYRKKKASTQNN